MAGPDFWAPTKKEKPNLKQRVVAAAEGLLLEQRYVATIDVLARIGWITPAHLDAWRKGRTEGLLAQVQVSPENMRKALNMLQQWAAEKGLPPAEGRYARAGRDGPVELKFTPDGFPQMEETLRQHFMAADLPERTLKALEQKQKRDPQPVVYQIPDEAQCVECGARMEKNSILWLEAGQPLCLGCAGWSDMEYLGAGDAALTRRAAKYSPRSAVVVRFSRARGRYERQGILVELQALEQAEQECAGDAEERAAARARGAVQRAKQDDALVLAMTARIVELFPRCPQGEARAIAEHTARRGSGRVGRSAAGRSLDDRALLLAVRAAIRHRKTNYDELLAGGMEREAARESIAAQVDEVLNGWRA